MHPPAELNEWHGCPGKGEDDSVRHRDATELLKLIQLLLETWGNVIKICRVFGVRSWEVAFITRVNNDDGEPQLRVTKGKTYNTRGGVKEETDPRWLEAVAAARRPSRVEEGDCSTPNRSSGAPVQAA